MAAVGAAGQLDRTELVGPVGLATVTMGPVVEAMAEVRLAQQVAAQGLAGMVGTLTAVLVVGPVVTTQTVQPAQ